MLFMTLGNNQPINYGRSFKPDLLQKHPLSSCGLWSFDTQHTSGSSFNSQLEIILRLEES